MRQFKGIAELNQHLMQDTFTACQCLNNERNKDELEMAQTIAQDTATPANLRATMVTQQGHLDSRFVRKESASAQKDCGNHGWLMVFAVEEAVALDTEVQCCMQAEQRSTYAVGTGAEYVSWLSS